MSAIAAIPEYSGDDSEPYIFTTVRWDPELLQCELNTAASGNQPCPIYMFQHHYDRLQVPEWKTQNYTTSSSPETNSEQQASNLLQALLTSISEWQKRNPNETAKSLRIKLRSYKTGHQTVEFAPIPQIPLTTLFPLTLFPSPSSPQAQEPIAWTVVLATHATPPPPEPAYKTSTREIYTHARHEANIPFPTTQKEVLLYTPSGNVFDGSITTPYFFRSGRWVTPSRECGGLWGTTRRWVVERGLVDEGIVAVESLIPGEVVWLSNAVKGFFRARFVVGREEMIGDR